MPDRFDGIPRETHNNSYLHMAGGEVCIYDYLIVNGCCDLWPHGGPGGAHTAGILIYSLLFHVYMHDSISLQEGVQHVTTSLQGAPPLVRISETSQS